MRVTEVWTVGDLQAHLLALQAKRDADKAAAPRIAAAAEVLARQVDGGDRTRPLARRNWAVAWAQFDTAFALPRLAQREFDAACFALGAAVSAEAVVVLDELPPAFHRSPHQWEDAVEAHVAAQDQSDTYLGSGLTVDDQPEGRD